MSIWTEIERRGWRQSKVHRMHGHRVGEWHHTFPSGEMVRTKSDDMWIELKKARSQQAMSRQFARWMKHPREWMGQGSKTMEQVHRERQKSEVKTCYRCDSRFMGHKEDWSECPRCSRLEHARATGLLPSNKSMCEELEKARKHSQYHVAESQRARNMKEVKS
jgi:hypothetical protein